MKQILSATFLLLLGAVSSPAASKIEIRFEKIPENLATLLDQFKCRGKFEKPGLLNDVGYSDVQLEKGVTCRMADFDGDGSPDYWIYNCDLTSHTCKSKVFLMLKGSVRMAINFPHSFDGQVVLEKKNRDMLKQAGCRLPKTSAIFELCDTPGCIYRLYVLNLKKGTFDEFSHCDATYEDYVE